MHFMKIALMACGGVLALAGLTAQAGPTSVLEVKIELRVMDFIAKPADRSAVAVVYDRDLRGTAEEAGAVRPGGRRPPRGLLIRNGTR